MKTNPTSSKNDTSTPVVATANANKPVDSGATVNQEAETVEIDLVQNPAEIVADEQAGAQKFVARGAVFNKEIQFEEKATNVKKAYEGCLYIIGRRLLQSGSEKIKTEAFNLLLTKSKLRQSTV